MIVLRDRSEAQVSCASSQIIVHFSVFGSANLNVFSLTSKIGRILRKSYGIHCETLLNFELYSDYSAKLYSLAIFIRIPNPMITQLLTSIP